MYMDKLINCIISNRCKRMNYVNVITSVLVQLFQRKLEASLLMPMLREILCHSAVDENNVTPIGSMILKTEKLIEFTSVNTYY